MELFNELGNLKMLKKESLDNMAYLCCFQKLNFCKFTATGTSLKIKTTKVGM